jgi:hypothetical protein
MTRFRIHTQDRLDRIEASVLAIRAPQDPQKVLQELGAFQPKQLSGALLTLQRTTEKPIAEFAPQPSTLRDVTAKLKEVTAVYWQGGAGRSLCGCW